MSPHHVFLLYYSRVRCTTPAESRPTLPEIIATNAAHGTAHRCVWIVFLLIPNR